MNFKGRDIPPRESPRLRSSLSTINEYLARSELRAGAGTPTSGIEKTASTARILQQTNTSTTEVRSIPIQIAGTILVLYFTGTPTVKDRAGNLKLDGDFIPRNFDENLTLVSDGLAWHEISRGSSGFATFVPAARWGAIPDTGLDMTGPIQDALDNVPEGSVLYFDPGTYIIEGTIESSRSNITIWLAPGAILLGDHTSAGGNLIDISGVRGAVTTDCTADVVERQQDGIAVDSTTGFAAGDWIVLEDDFKPDITSEPLHLEVNRVKAVTDATHLKLYYPTVDAYTTADVARVTVLAPVENFHVTGGGTISNPGTTSTTGGHGLVFRLAVNCGADNLIFEQVRNQALKLEETLCFTASKCIFRDAQWFQSNGYGIATTSAISTIITDCHALRLRHSFDISFFSRDTVISNCSVRSAAFTAYQVHPNANRTIFSNCIADGVRGYDNATGFEMDDGSNQGHGLDVREDCKSVHVRGCIFANIGQSGVSIDNDGCEDITIQGNTFYNCNLRGGFAGSAIHLSDRSNISNDVPNLVVKGNSIYNCYGIGIFCSINSALIEGNQIWEMSKGTSSPQASGSATTYAYGILCTFPIYSSTEPLFSTLTDIVIRGNTIIASAEQTKGIVLGSTDAMATVIASNTYAILQCLIENNFITGSTLTGIDVVHATKTVTGQTAEVFISTGNIVRRNDVRNCNSTDTLNHAGIRASDVASMNNGEGGCDIVENVLVGNERVGILCGYNGQLIRNNQVGNTVGPDSGIGIGIYCKSHDASIALSNLIFDNNTVWGSELDGLRINEASGVGNVDEVQIIGGSYYDNGRYGVRVMDLTDRTVVRGVTCWNNVTAGLRIEGANCWAISPVSYDSKSTPTQDYGIDIADTASGTVLHGPVAWNNQLGNIRDLSGLSLVDLPGGDVCL